MADNLKEALNEAGPNNMADIARGVLLGDALASSGVRALQGAVVTANRLTLGENAKALAILACYARTGGTTTPITPIFTPGVAPAATQCAVGPEGDILFNAADAITSVDVVYVSPDADVEELVLNVVASAAVLPSSKRAWLMISAIVTVGIVLGSKTLVARGSAPAATQFAIADDGATINFNAADVVAGTVTVRAMVARTQGMTAKLAATTGF
jgi:hypothetical protein